MDGMLPAFLILDSAPTSDLRAIRSASEEIFFTGFSFKESSRRSVIIAAIREIKEHTNIILSLPRQFERGRNIMDPKRAPTFPLAAHTPFRVDRHGREKVILGIMKVYTK